MAEETDVKRVAFVSTRIAGIDGVSLEIAKWAHVLKRAGLVCCCIAGEPDRLRSSDDELDSLAASFPT
jgi:hypothetical protein